MPNWRKVITSGSDASLASLVVTNAVSASAFSGSFFGDGSGLTGIGGAGIFAITGSSYNTTNNLEITGSVTATSFVGDGSALIGITATVSQESTVTASFSNTTSTTVNHGFDSLNVIVSVYDTDRYQIIPKSVNLASNNSVDVTFSENTSGTVVVAKGGHIVSGSQIEVPTVADTFTSVTSTTVTHNFNTKNVIISVYDDNDNYIIPASINLNTVNSAVITFSEATSGTVVVAKGGHIVYGSVGNASKLDSQLPSYYLNFNNLTNVPANLISGSSQVSFTGLSNTPSGLVSGSSQISFTEVSNVPNLVSSSAQGEITSSGHLVPGVNEVYDLGSATLRWRDLYLSGSTIDLGGTLITRDASGDINFKDSQTSNLKRVVVDELQIGTGETARKFKVDNGRIKFTDVNDVDKVDTSLSLPAGTVSGSSQINFGDLSNIPINLISGSSQIDYSQLSNIPSGIVSSSAQITGMAVAMAIVFG